MINVLEVMETDERHQQKPADPAYAEGSAYIVDTYVPITEAAIPITDCGFLRADAAYDVATVSRGQFFRLDHHLDRFFNSVAKFDLVTPYDRDKLKEILIELVRLAGFKDAYVWWATTRGDMPHDAKDRVFPDKYTNKFYAFVIPYVSINDDDMRQRGQNIILSRKYVRIPPNAIDPTAKNFHWMDLMMSLFEAGRKGAEWSLLAGVEGYLAEGPGVNAFIVKDGKVLTPSFGCLGGVTRRSVIDLCEMEGIPLIETTITADDMREADEIFITSEAGGIMPSGTLDGEPIGGGKGPGPITAKLHDLYWNKRWEGWDSFPVPYAE